MHQTNIFDVLYEKYKIQKPIRLIEFFAGYGSQALALKYLNVEFEHWKICEWATKSIQAYKDIHFDWDRNDYSLTFSEDEIKDFLLKKGISSNYNEPMNEKQIKRMTEKTARNIFNNIIATHNLVNIQQVKGKDLEIKDTDKYDYILTYSFPCQDLSNAGKRAGMDDTSTRSGMLWEVERILDECKQIGDLPQILLMENVPQVIGVDNVDNFVKWTNKLEKLGYKNYWQNLIATDYGIPQTRNRTFMVSILGDYSYTFPPKQELKLKLKDMLEDQVDEKYYLSDKMLNCFLNPSESGKKFGRDKQFLSNLNKEVAATITTLAGNRATDNFIQENNEKVITLGNYMPSNHNASKVIDVNGSAPTIMENYGTITAIKEEKLKKELCNNLIKNNLIKENDVIRHSYTNSRMNGEMKDLKQNNISPTLDTRCDCLGVCVNDVLGTYQYSKSDNFMKGKDRFQPNKEVSDTLQTTPKEGVVVSTTPMVLGGIGDKKSNSGTQWYQQDRVYDNNVSIALTTVCNPNYIDKNLRIRKLTPRECFRLMAVRNEDFNKVSKNQSDASLYHLAGDSIVVDVLMAIFKELL